jgi:hypothetical protein
LQENAQRPTSNVEVRKVQGEAFIRLPCVMDAMRKMFFVLVMAGLLVDGQTANANPVEDFFRKLGNSIGHPEKKSRPRKNTSASKPPDNNPSPAPGASASQTVGPPNQQNVRGASAAPTSKGAKRDVPYGIPVPGRKGFVTSPFAPDAGYVDVRSFSPGTEVKDPYTGKVFRTP